MKDTEISSDIVTGENIVSQKEDSFKSIKEKFQNGKTSLFSASSKIKKTITSNLYKKAEETNDFFDNVKNKNTRIINLENYLGLDKTCMISSDKSANVYKLSYGKIVIIEKDVTGDPYIVTVKEFSDVQLYVVKYDKYLPYVYPSYDDKNIKGSLFYLDTDQIWYKDTNSVTVLYKVGQAMHNIIINFSDIPGINKDNFHQSIKNYFTIVNSPSLTKLVTENSIDYIDIMRIKSWYVLIKNDDAYSVFIYDNDRSKFKEHFFRKLPDIQINNFDILFSPDVFSFILKNNYPIEDFQENNGFIEYNEIIGKSKVCVFRCKI
ncbi:MAG: hypothetical protein Q8900_07090 [Bacillota bacterium]|nr:hypothetical protein [Bacillota bacterium]